MDNQTLEMKMNEIINGTEENQSENDMINMQMEKLNNAAPMNNDIQEEVINVPTIEDYNNNPEQTVTHLNGIAGKVQEALGGESVMTSQIVQEQVVPNLPPDIITPVNTIAPTQNEIPTPPSTKPTSSSGKRGRAVKHTPDYAKLESEFLNNFDSNSKEDKYKLLMKLPHHLQRN